MKIHKGDTVQIVIGKDSGKSGKVMTVDPKTNKLTVDGLNLYKKHIRPKRQGEKGEIVSVPRPMDISNAAIICSGCKKVTRAGYKIEGSKKTRICKKCQRSI